MLSIEKEGLCEAGKAREIAQAVEDHLASRNCSVCLLLLFPLLTKLMFLVFGLARAFTINHEVRNIDW